MMDTIADVASQVELNWTVLNAGGWEYLVPPLSEQTVLCIDSIGVIGTLVARWGARTVVLTADGCEDSVRQVMGVSGCRNFKVVPFSSWTRASNGELNEFDGVICHDLSGREIGGDLHRLQAILTRVRASLRADGFIYLGMRNAYAIDRLLGRMGARSGRPVSIWRAMSVLDKTGFSQWTRHPFLLANDRLQEVISKDGYVPSKNPSKLTERAKRALFGRIGSQFLAPAYGVVAYADAVRPTLVVRVTQLLRDTGIFPHQDRGRVVVKQYLVLNGGKVILRIGFAAGDDSDVVAVLVRDPQSLARREREAEILDLLARSNSNFVNLFPKLLGRMQMDGAHCFVLTRLPGMTLDQDVPELEQVTNAAFDFLVSFHRETTQSVVVDSGAFDGAFVALFDSARQRNPCQLRELLALEEMVRERVVGVSLPNVWMHGDFKVENVMYDPKTLALSGVIDWELSRCPGLPLLDLHYLHIYNRIIEGHSWTDAVRAVCLSERHSGAEERRYRQYVDVLQLKKEWIPVLNVMFLIHHLGCRFQTNTTDERVQGQVSSLMRECMQMLGAMAPNAVEEIPKEGEC